MRYRLFIFVSLQLFCLNSYAEQCAAIFPDAAQNNNNGGFIQFNWQAKVTNSPDNILDTRNLIDNAGGNSCNTSACSRSNQVVPTVNYNNFPANSNNVNVSWFSAETISPGDYNNITVNTWGTLSLMPGDYRIRGNVSLLYLSNIRVVGNGIVRFFVKNDLTINSSVDINNNGSAQQLLIYGAKDIVIGSSSRVSAFIYNQNGVILNSHVVINGAVTAENITLVSEAVINFDNNEPDFGDFCGSTPLTLIANYQFDECAYTGSVGDVVDQIGSFPGQSFSTLETSADAQIERSANIFDANHHIETSIPLNGDFTISTWFKKPTANSGSRYFVLGAMANGGGDLLYLDRNRNYRWGVYDGIRSSNGSFRFGTLTGGWHHLSLVYSGNSTTLFIDGDDKGSVGRRPSGTLKYIGTSYDDVNGLNPQGFRAPLDEFKLFDKALSDTDILAIYNNELTGNNYDGGTRLPVDCLSIDPIAEYRLEQNGWSGTPDEVIDEQGNFPGTAYNGATTDLTSPAIPTDLANQGTCAYGAFDGFDDYVQIEHDPLLNLSTELTVTVWVNTNVIPRWGLKSIVSKDENFEFHITSSAEINWWWGTNSFTTSGVNITPGTWYHIAITYRSGEQVIYVDGVPRASRSFVGNLPLNSDPLQIGQDQGFWGRYFDGYIDEVRIYDQALSAADIFTIYNETHLCNLPLSRLYQIQHDGSGLTCSPEPVTIRACSNASCSSYDNAVDENVVLMVGNIPKTVAITNGSSNGESFVYTDPNTPVTLSLTTDYLCLNTTDQSNSCQLDFADTGFRFLSNGQPVDIPTQLSDKPSNIGFNQRILSLQAVTTNPQTGVCEAALLNDVVIEISATCSNESNCANKNVVITNAITQANTIITPTNNGVANTFFPIALNFGDNTENAAPFIFTYPDAGKMNLNVRYDLPDESGAPSGNYMAGNSNGFVVRPLGFYLGVQSNPEAIDANGAVYKKAGEDFTVSAKAVVWQRSDDRDDNGVPDNNVDLEFNPATVNFGQETSAYGATITAGFVAPTAVEGATLGQLSVTDFTNFVNGISTITSNYSEVGIIDFSVNVFNNNNNNSYLGADDVTGYVANVGRFTPAYFEQVIIDSTSGVAGGEGTLVANHDNATATCQMLTWAYSGQQTANEGTIRYGVEPTLTITPYNVLGDGVKNYIGDFAKLVTNLSATTVEFGAPKTLHVNGLEVTGDVSSQGVMTEIADGKLEYTLSASHHFTYTRNNLSKVAPFKANFELPINNIIDSDTIKLRPASAGSTYFENPLFYQSLVPAFDNSIEVRFGRWIIENAFGPETVDLPVKMSIEQFNGIKFVSNVDENCVTPLINKKELGGSIGDPLTLFDYRLLDTNSSDSLLTAHTDATTDLSAFSNGFYDVFIFSAPKSGRQGTLKMEYDVPAWLKFDWLQSDQQYDDNPVVSITFGRYRGNDRIIYWREN